MTKLSIQQVQSKYQDQIMAIAGVVGIGIGSVNDELMIKVLVVKKTKELEQKIPETLENYKIVIQETGEIRAL